MQSFILFLFSAVTGYVFFLYFSHPNKKKNKIPCLKIKNVEILPNIKIHFRSHTYHFHHWFNLALLSVLSLVLFESLLHFTVVKGALVGGILQGLRYPDRFKFKHPRLS